MRFVIFGGVTCRPGRLRRAAVMLAGLLMLAGCKTPAEMQAQQEQEQQAMARRAAAQEAAQKQYLEQQKQDAAQRAADQAAATAQRAADWAAATATHERYITQECATYGITQADGRYASCRIAIERADQFNLVSDEIIKWQNGISALYLMYGQPSPPPPEYWFPPGQVCARLGGFSKCW